jgi:hypothetical protein
MNFRHRASCSRYKILEVADKKGNSLVANKRRIRYTLFIVDEGRKRVILIAACILAARKLTQWDGRNSPASESAISDAIALAERIMAKIDSRWPVRL